MIKQIKSTKVIMCYFFIHIFNKLTFVRSIPFELFVLNNLSFSFFLDLPADTPLTDLSKLADLDMKKLPNPEESGDRCIRRIQEFLIHEMSSTECGVLPEDKLQRLLVGVSIGVSLSQTHLPTRVRFFSEANSSQTRVRTLPACFIIVVSQPT